MGTTPTEPARSSPALEDEGIDSKCKTQNLSAGIGFFAKDRFVVDLDDDTVTCPDGVTVQSGGTQRQRSGQVRQGV